MRTILINNLCYQSKERIDNKCVFTLLNNEKIQMPERCNFYTTSDGCLQSSQLQLSISQYSFLSSLSGLLFGFTIFIVVLFSFVYMGRK